MSGLVPLRIIVNQLVRSSIHASRNTADRGLAAVDLHTSLCWPRGYASSQTGGDTEPSTSGAATATPGEATEGAAMESGMANPAGLAVEGLEEQQVPTRRKGRRPTRADTSSWAEDGLLMEEMDEAAIQVPDDMPMYDVRTDIPWHFEPRMPYADMLERIREADPELLEVLDEEEHPPPYPGAKSILHWTTNMVLMAGPDDATHPLNRKAKLQVYVRDLQDECGLTDAALQHIALICGPRYNPKKGLLTLTSEKYPGREENRRDLLDTLHALVDEGERAFPQTDDKIRALQEERRAAREAAQWRGVPVPNYNPINARRQARERQAASTGAQDAAKL